jgi:hypothetical protein
MLAQINNAKPMQVPRTGKIVSHVMFINCHLMLSLFCYLSSQINLKHSITSTSWCGFDKQQSNESDQSCQNVKHSQTSLPRILHNGQPRGFQPQMKRFREALQHTSALHGVSLILQHYSIDDST